MRRLAPLVVALTMLATAPAAPAAAPTHRELEKYSSLYHAVARKQGKRAPGRNIRKYGVLRHGQARLATAHEVARSIRALRALSRPYVTSSQPSQPPAGVMSVAPAGTASCIVQHESHGDPTATNGQYGGIAQWSPEAWQRMGGTRYAASPTQASYTQQVQVLSYGLSHYGCHDWCPYDGCG